MFGVPPNILRRSRNPRGRPKVRILLHRPNDPELARIVPDVIPRLVQITFRPNQPVKRFVLPDRAASVHDLVYLVRRERFDAV
jgi:hypothetical protein